MGLFSLLRIFGEASFPKKRLILRSNATTAADTGLTNFVGEQGTTKAADFSYERAPTFPMRQGTVLGFFWEK